uniref:Unkown protein n=1 Tax=Riptortus pedestris TaxID=329032 RepID=R4WKL3_RIPPE|nr:unkown protein [Riptortus pedestris]
MDIDYKEVFPETSQTELPEIPEEGSEDSESVPETDVPSQLPCEKQVNRRFNLRPRKRPCTDIEGNIKKVLHNVIKSKGPLRRQHLETIFEEPIKENGKVVLISVTKAKRSISFSQFVSKAKQKKRKAKAKKILDRISEARVNEVQRQFWKMDL